MDFRVTMETHLGMFKKTFSERFITRGKSHCECGWRHQWGKILNRRRGQECWGAAQWAERLLSKLRGHNLDSQHQQKGEMTTCVSSQTGRQTCGSHGNSFIASLAKMTPSDSVRLSQEVMCRSH